MNKGAGSGSCPRVRGGFLYTHTTGVHIDLK